MYVPFKLAIYKYRSIYFLIDFDRNIEPDGIV